MLDKEENFLYNYGACDKGEEKCFVENAGKRYWVILPCAYFAALGQMRSSLKSQMVWRLQVLFVRLLAPSWGGLLAVSGLQKPKNWTERVQDFRLRLLLFQMFILQ